MWILPRMREATLELLLLVLATRSAGHMMCRLVVIEIVVWLLVMIRMAWQLALIIVLRWLLLLVVRHLVVWEERLLGTSWRRWMKATSRARRHWSRYVLQRVGHWGILVVLARRWTMVVLVIGLFLALILISFHVFGGRVRLRDVR